MLGKANRGRGWRRLPGVLTWPLTGAPPGPPGTGPGPAGGWPMVTTGAGPEADTTGTGGRPPLGPGAGPGKNVWPALEAEKPGLSGATGRGGSWRRGRPGPGLGGGPEARGSGGRAGEGGRGAVRVPSLTTLFTGGGELRAKVH